MFRCSPRIPHCLHQQFSSTMKARSTPVSWLSWQHRRTSARHHTALEFGHPSRKNTSSRDSAVSLFLAYGRRARAADAEHHFLDTFLAYHKLFISLSISLPYLCSYPTFTLIPFLSMLLALQHAVILSTSWPSLALVHSSCSSSMLSTHDFPPLPEEILR